MGWMAATTTETVHLNAPLEREKLLTHRHTTMSSFERLGVRPEIIRATQKLDWLLPTAVQDEAIPLILGGGDVMVAAETGSGKTAAFGIPILQTVYESLRGEGGTSTKPKTKKRGKGEQETQSIGSIQLR